jgi:competence protein ComEA
MTRFAIVAAVLALAAFALWHPAPGPPAAAVQPAARAVFGPHAPPRRRRDSGAGDSGSSEPVVYVAGAVRRPGLYRLHPGDRAGDAIRLAGGIDASAEPWGVNLAARLRDGDEVYVATRGEHVARGPAVKRSRRARATPEPAADVDVNRADAQELGRVPGIGRAIAERIVELRERDGPFASLDELLDVGGMSGARLERARPFLRPP